MGGRLRGSAVLAGERLRQLDGTAKACEARSQKHGGAGHWVGEIPKHPHRVPRAATPAVRCQSVPAALRTAPPHPRNCPPQTCASPHRPLLRHPLPPHHQPQAVTQQGPACAARCCWGLHRSQLRRKVSKSRVVRGGRVGACVRASSQGLPKGAQQVSCWPW